MGGGKTPALPALPTQSTADVQAAAQAERQRWAAAQGQQATILGSAQNQQLNPANVQRKTLLGQ